MERDELKQEKENFNSRFDNLEAMLQFKEDFKFLRLSIERFMSHLTSEQNIQTEHGREILILKSVVMGDPEQKQLGINRKVQILWGCFRTFDRALMFASGALTIEFIHWCFKQ